MEQQISIDSTDTHVEQVDLERVQNVGLIEDVKISRRRVHIDILIIVLVLANFLEFVLKIYSTTDLAVIKHPTNNHSGKFDDFLVEEDKYIIIPLDHWNFLATSFGSRFLFSLIFFISGCNVFYSLCKRSERQFRNERVHRLLVPMLTMCFLQFTDGISYFAPMDPVCQLRFETNISFGEYTRDINRDWYLQRTVKICQANFLFNDYPNPFNDTPSFFSNLVVNMNLFIGLISVINILLLFIFSQMFGFWFCVFHPKHNKQGEPEIPYCGSTCCCCSRKPINCITKACCCLNFLCKPASNPTEFIAAVDWYLGGSVRLILVPGIFVFLGEIPDLILEGISGLNLLFPNMVFYLLGYTVAATEYGVVGQLCKKYRWIYFYIGLACCVVDSVVILIFNDLDNNGFIHNEIKSFAILPILALLKAFGGWVFILGLFHIAKETFTDPKVCVMRLRELAMPFYLTHSNLLTIYMAGAFWVPFLRALPFTLFLGALITGIVSFLITKAGFLRYFFGLPCPKNPFFPGKCLGGFLPVIIMAVVILAITIAYHSIY